MSGVVIAWSLNRSSIAFFHLNFYVFQIRSVLFSSVQFSSAQPSILSSYFGHLRLFDKMKDIAFKTGVLLYYNLCVQHNTIIRLLQSYVAKVKGYDSILIPSYLIFLARL